MQKEFVLYELVESEAGQLIMNKRKMFKPVRANVDFYSGFVYTMLGIPEEMFTPMFGNQEFQAGAHTDLRNLLMCRQDYPSCIQHVGYHRPYVTWTRDNYV